MKKYLILFVIVLLTTGCASIPKQSFNAEANRNIRSITLLEPVQVNQIQVGIIHHPGNSFGLIGAAIAAADTSAKTAAYNNALGGNKVNWSAYTQQLLKNSLEKSGYTVKTLKVRKSGASADFLKNYPKTETDAILDYHFSVHQTATGPTTSYIPTVQLFSRLVRASDQAVLYAEHFTSGNPTSAVKESVKLSGSSGFKNMAALKARPEESIEALKKGIGKITDKISNDLKG